MSDWDVQTCLCIASAHPSRARLTRTTDSSPGVYVASVYKAVSPSLYCAHPHLMSLPKQPPPVTRRTRLPKVVPPLLPPLSTSPSSRHSSRSGSAAADDTCNSLRRDSLSSTSTQHDALENPGVPIIPWFETLEAAHYRPDILPKPPTPLSNRSGQTLFGPYSGTDEASSTRSESQLNFKDEGVNIHIVPSPTRSPAVTSLTLDSPISPSPIHSTLARDSPLPATRRHSQFYLSDYMVVIEVSLPTALATLEYIDFKSFR